MTNLHFLVRSFDGLKGDDLPPLDFTAAHGLLSWVNDRVRRALRDAVARHLKPDGIAMLSYNVDAGYAAPASHVVYHAPRGRERAR